MRTLKAFGSSYLLAMVGLLLVAYALALAVPVSEYITQWIFKLNATVIQYIFTGSVLWILFASALLFRRFSPDDVTVLEMLMLAAAFMAFSFVAATLGAVVLILSETLIETERLRSATETRMSIEVRQQLMTVAPVTLAVYLLPTTLLLILISKEA